jgi:hypothetical protein
MARKRKLTEDEMIVFGKMCGCDKCKYCNAWSREQTIQAMLNEVSRGKQIAETARKELIESWRKQDGY